MASASQFITVVVSFGQLQLQLSHYWLVALQAFCFPKCEFWGCLGQNFLGSLSLAIFSGPLINYAIIRPLVIWETVFKGQKTQPTVSKYWKNTYSTSITETYNKRTINTKHNKSLVYSVSQKIPLRGHDIFHFVHKRLRNFNRFLHTYYTFLSTLVRKFLFNYPRFLRSYAILSVTNQFT